MAAPHVSGAPALLWWATPHKGQLGYGSTDELHEAAGAVPVGGAVKSLSAGWTSTCAVLEGGAARRWGNGVQRCARLRNSLNIGDAEPASAAGDLEPGGLVAEIRAGWNHACARWENGAVRCWGFVWLRRPRLRQRPHNVGDNESPSPRRRPAAAPARTFALARRAPQLRAPRPRAFLLGRGRSGRLVYANTNTIDNETGGSAGFVQVQ